MKEKNQIDLQFHRQPLLAILQEVIDTPDRLSGQALTKLLHRHARPDGGLYSRSQLIYAYREMAGTNGLPPYSEELVQRLRRKPIRTSSGVTPVTVLTKPFPCPGECIFCPSDVRMPKSYLSREPGAQRAAQHEFDPYSQTLSRIQAFYNNGHRVDKIELIILGGTWSFYPQGYQIWFVKRCFEAMNDFAGGGRRIEPAAPPVSFRTCSEEVDGLTLERSYNQVISSSLSSRRPRGRGGSERLIDGACSASWRQLEEVQAGNEEAAARCVGLVVETRPDHLDAGEVVRIRRLGATKVQIGVQSLSDEVLRLNRRGHDVAATRRAFRLLRQGGFKIHAHWMPNLYGSDPARDVEDFGRLFADPDLRPDELKIYPCSLIESAELMQYHRDGRWRPYDHQELTTVLSECLLRVPAYCRLTRMIRDIPGDDIHAGNRITNFRQVVDKELARRRRRSVDIRAREIRGAAVDPGELALDRVRIPGPHFVEAGRGHRPEAVPGHFVRTVAEPTQRGQIVLANRRVVFDDGAIDEIGRHDAVSGQDLLRRALVGERADAAPVARMGRVPVELGLGIDRDDEGRRRRRGDR